RRRRPTRLVSDWRSDLRSFAEKIPFDCLRAVEYDMKDERLPRTGIYLAHDSMGAVRYAGRGSIFTRLATRKKEQFLQLHYFSFYVILDKSTNARLRLWRYALQVTYSTSMNARSIQPSSPEVFLTMREALSSMSAKTRKVRKPGS